MWHPTSFAHLAGALASVALHALSHASPSPGCANPLGAIRGTNTSHTFVSNGTLRSYIISIPSSYDYAYGNGTGAPLILGFHGSTRTSSYFQTMSQFSNATLNPDHVAVYPQGIGNHWQGSPYAVAGVSDIQFVSNLLDNLTKTYCLDTSRFYASGHSNGGGFVNTLACWPGVSGRFAAFAPMSAAIYNGSTGPNGTCAPDKVVTPMLEFHGKADKVVPYKGGTAQGWTVPPILDWVAGWVKRNGCPNGDLSQNTTGPVTVYTNTLCRVQHYAFTYMPHLWACNTTDYVPPGDFLTPVEATSVAIAFFRLSGSMPNPIAELRQSQVHISMAARRNRMGMDLGS